MNKTILLLFVILIFSNFSSINVFSQGVDINSNNLNIFYNEMWDVELVDSIGESGWYSDIKIWDDVTYISYYDRLGGNLKIAIKRDNIWSIETVDSLNDVGKYSSIDVDSEGNPYISYFDETNKNLKYSTWNGMNWVIELIDFEGDVGYDSSICIDQNDDVHISYYDATNGDLKYARKVDSDWVIEVVAEDGNSGTGSSITVDSYNNPHISYANAIGPGLFYAYKDGSNWINQIVDVECKKVFGSTSLDLDLDSNPHIAYFDVGTQDEEWYLKHAYYEENNWIIEIIDPDIMNFWYDWGVSINSGNNEIIHLAYYDWPERNLNYAWKINDIWSIETVDSEGAVGSYCSIDIDTNGYPSISYMDRSYINLKIADKKQYSPSKPLKPSGHPFGLSDREYIFTTSSVDFDGDKISYGWDWGEDDEIEWTEYYNSNQSVYINHTWKEDGIFQIRVRAKDENGNQGNWSDLLNFRIIKTHNKIILSNSFLKIFTDLF